MIINDDNYLCRYPLWMGSDRIETIEHLFQSYFYIQIEQFYRLLGVSSDGYTCLEWSSIRDILRSFHSFSYFSPETAVCR